MRRPHLLLAFALLAACAGARRSAMADTPGAEEYAVWSAALDAQFGSMLPRFAVVEQTSSWGPLSPGEIEFLRTHWRLPVAMLEDYNARNARRARVRPGLLHPGSVRLLPRSAGRPGPMGEKWEPPWITLSRVGFDPSGTRALVSLMSDCGSLCNGGALLALERDGSGSWKKASAPMVMYF